MNIEKEQLLRGFVFLDFEIVLRESGYRVPLGVGDDNIDADAANISL